MATVGLFEAKQKLSELVERARSGEEIEITRHGKLVARLVPPGNSWKKTWKEIFDELDEYRKGLNPDISVDTQTIRELINEGRG